MYYNFKRDTELFLVYNGLRYKLAVYSDISFSQTFEETDRRVKTLHNSINFSSGTITKASPANFSFSAPLVPQQAILISLLVGFDRAYTATNAFELYAVSTTDTYKISSCILENGRFIISESSVLGVTLSGSGAKLERVGNAAYSLPGILQPVPEPLDKESYTRTVNMQVKLDGLDLDNITEVSLELQNRVEWLENSTIQASLGVTSAENTIYPSNFVVSERILNGSITQYITDLTATTPQSWSTNSQVYIRVGTGGREWALQMYAPEAIFTNRAETSDVFTQVYDFRMSSDLELAEGIT